MGDKVPPLTDKQVKEEAKKLEKHASDFMSGEQEAAFNAWHKELREISRHGVTSTRDVFKQIEQDRKGIKPVTEKIFRNEGGGIAELIIQPSSAGRLFGSKEYIGSVVNSETVLSSAIGKKGHRFADITKQDNLGTNPFDRLNSLDYLLRMPNTKR